MEPFQLADRLRLTVITDEALARPRALSDVVREALAAFKRATGEPIEFVVGARREGDIEQIYASVDKAERVLGWKASRSIEEAMLDAWRWQGRLSTR